MAEEIITPDGNLPVVPPVGTEGAKPPQNQTTDPLLGEDDYVPFKEGTEVKPPKELEDGAGDDEDTQLIRKEAKTVAKNITAPLKSGMDAIQAEMEANAFLSRKDSEVYLPYADTIRNIARDPRTRNFPMKTIIAMAIGPDKLLRMGAEMERKAAAEASATGTGGSNARANSSNGGMKNAFELSEDEFNKAVSNHRL